ncbi:MAG: methionyl-tRNA formyltransferase [Krumholzibacteria bacterium]|nr:methionyl-tRNA formyltransferase [Candidatus Krumholzibacteria bacterium]
MRIVFMGSPDFAVPSLDALVEARFDVCLVVTQPDRGAGRGRRLLPTAVKAAARAHGLPVLDFGKGDRKAVTEAVLAQQPDAVVVVAFGHILKEPLLSTPRFGCINVHASLLPRWRGVSPVQYAVMHGDSWTGVTIMRMDEGVDTGPVLAERSLAIAPEDSAGELLDRLAGQGADLLIHTLRRLANGQVDPVPQNDEGAVYAPKLTRSLSAVRWDRHCVTVHNQIRALSPWPGTTTYLGEQLLKITEARPCTMRATLREPGTVLASGDEGVVVACGEGAVRLTGLQVPGKKPLPVDAFLRGFAIVPGDVLRS